MENMAGLLEINHGKRRAPTPEGTLHLGTGIKRGQAAGELRSRRVLRGCNEDAGEDIVGIDGSENEGFRLMEDRCCLHGGCQGGSKLLAYTIGRSEVHNFVRRRVYERGSSYGVTCGFLSLGVDVYLFVWVDVVSNRSSKVNVGVAMLPLG